MAWNAKLKRGNLVVFMISRFSSSGKSEVVSDKECALSLSKIGRDPTKCKCRSTHAILATVIADDAVRNRAYVRVLYNDDDSEGEGNDAKKYGCLRLKNNSTLWVEKRKLFDWSS